MKLFLFTSSMFLYLILHSTVSIAQSCFLSPEYAFNGTGPVAAGPNLLTNISESEMMNCQVWSGTCQFHGGVVGQSGVGTGGCSIQNDGTGGIGSCENLTPIQGTSYPYINSTPSTTWANLKPLLIQYVADGNAVDFNKGYSYQETLTDYGPCSAFKRFTVPSGYVFEDESNNHVCSQGQLSSIQSGSILDCRDQNMFQKVPVTGTPFNLVYSSESNRQSNFPTRTFTYVLPSWSHPFQSGNRWALSGARIIFTIAGRTYIQTLAASNFYSAWAATFTWDGKDQNGNWVPGRVSGEITAYYDYVEGWTPSPTELHSVTKTSLMGQFDDPGRVRGWALDIYHNLDISTKVVRLGNGMEINVPNSATFSLNSNGNFRIPSEDGSEIYEFSSTGQHLKTFDVLTGITLFTFQHTLGKLTAITDRDGLSTTIGRDSSGRMISLTNPYGIATTLSYDTDDNIVSIQDPQLNTQSFGYNTGSYAGLMSSATDRSGKTKYYSYDSSGKLIGAQDARGGSKYISKSSVAFNDSGNETVTFADQMGRNTLYKTKTWTDGTKTLTNSFPTGRVVQQDVNRDSSYFANYDNSGINSTIEFAPHPLFPSRNVVYQTSNSAAAYTESTTTRVFNLDIPSDPLSTNSYTETTNVDGVNYVSTYNRSANSIQTTSPLGLVSTTILNSKGRISSISEPGVAQQVYNYNTSGQLTSTTQSNRTTLFNYDVNGRVQSVENSLGEITSYTYDANGRVLTETLANGKTLGYTYDANGSVISITNPSLKTYSYTYDENRNVINNSEPSVGSVPFVWSYEYNAADELKKITQPDNTLANFTISASSGLKSSESATNLSRSFTYYTNGNLNKITTPTNQTVTFSNTAIPELVTWAGTVAGSLGYSWSVGQRLLSLTVNSGTPVVYGYNSEGMITSADDLSISRSLANGFLTGTTQGVVTTAQTYNTFGELDTVSVSKGASALVSFDYDRDALGRITQIAKTLAGSTTITNFTYDSVGQLTSETSGTVTKNYTYSDNGNRMVTGGSETYDDQDRLVSDSSWLYTYSKKGFLVRKDHVSNGSNIVYIYDDFGNLITVLYSNGTRVDYQIDGLDRRIRKRLNNAFSSALIYQDQLRPIAQLNSNNTIKSIFVYGSKPNVPDYMIQGTVKYRIISDHLGSPLYVIRTSNGTIAQQMTYDSWGKVLTDSSPGFQPFGFAGGIYDATTGLVRFGARDYDASIGRWLNKDPIRHEGGMNLYGYVGNDPVNHVDPDGHRKRFVFRDGVLTLYDDDGSTIFQGSSASGPWGNGSLPNGLYNVGNLRKNRGGSYSCSGNSGYSLDLEPTFLTTRRDLRIHPDGGIKGTLGCVGINCVVGGGADTLGKILDKIFRTPATPDITLEVK